MPRLLLCLGALALACCSAWGQAPLDASSLEKDLKFNDLFPRRPFTGKQASGVAWSYDDRYAVLVWNEFEENGTDLWLYDTKDRKLTRLTTPDMMAAFDRDIPKIKERWKLEDDRMEKLLKLEDSEYRKELLRIQEEDRRQTGPRPSYSIGQTAWANKKHELLFVYRGDIFVWKLGDKAPRRLTRTREQEAQVQYSQDDSGFFFRRGDGVFRMKFSGPEVTQLNPELPNGLTLGGYSISPDESKMMISTGRSTGQGRQVDYITYRQRFAQAQRTPRQVADDPFNQESYLFLIDLNDDPEKTPGEAPKPFEIWKWAGGKDWEEASVANNPWSADGRLFTFGVFKRSSKELSIQVADLARRRVRTLHTAVSDGEHTSGSLSDPFFMKDGKIVAMMETSGWRHAWEIDPDSRKARQVTDGSFEVYPMEALKDGSGFLARSSKEALSQSDIYRVAMDGTMTRLTSRPGSYMPMGVSKGQKLIMSSFNSWDQLRELTLIGGKEEATITNSHRPGFFDIIKLKPQIFSYLNRHNDTVYGFKFLPPDLKPGERRPLFLYVYGGPLGVGKSVENGAFNSTAYLFCMYLTYTLGYITATIDPRGQSGYGARFGKANFGAPGEAQTEDLVDAVNYFDRTYGIDRARVGLTGWSFGGFQTQHAMYTVPDVFTLGIAGAGPTEWQNYNNWYSTGVIGETKLNSPDDLDKFSLTKVAERLRNPLLLLHGIEDTNVLFQDTIAVYRKLLQAGKGHLVELSVDPTGGHGMGGDMSNRDRHAIYLAFILKHWGLPGKRS